MSFLYPLLWLGALGAAVPLWLHLRQKQPENILKFSAVRFLDDLPRPRSGSYRLRDPLLLALRVLALLLAVAAFAWPFLKKATPVVTASRVHLLDATLSQQAEDGFDEDRRAVLDAVARSGSSVQDAVIALAGRPDVAVGFADDAETAERRLRVLEPSHQRGSYLEAFRLANTLLAQSLGLEKEIVVYGDYQKNQWSEHETSPPFLRDVKVTLAGEPAKAARANLALHEPRSRFFFLGDRTFVDLTVDLAHQGPAETAGVDIRVDGESVLNRDFGLTGPASSLTLRARWQTDPAKWVRGTAIVSGGPDELAADNRAFFTIPPVREGRLALLARSPYLRAALAPDVMRGRWVTQRLDPTRADPDAPLAELADVLVAEVSYAQSERIRRLVLRYLNNERGVVLLLDRVTPLVKGFLRDLDLEALEPGEDRQGPQTFRYFNVYHPIFQPFVAGELGDLLATRVHRHVRLRSSSAGPLIYGHAGGALMAEGRSTKGRLLVFTFGFDLGQTDWPIQPSFIPFLDLTLQYARAATPLETSQTPGDLFEVKLPDGHAVAEVTVFRETVFRETVLRETPGGETPGGEGPLTEALRVAVEPGAGQVRFRVPDEPGIYRVTLDGDREPHLLLAVNPAPEESRLVYDAEPAALAAWTLAGSGGGRAETAALDLEIVPRSEILSQRAWWWLALLSLVFLSFESALLGLRKESP